MARSSFIFKYIYIYIYVYIYIYAYINIYICPTLRFRACIESNGEEEMRVGNYVSLGGELGTVLTQL